MHKLVRALFGALVMALCLSSCILIAGCVLVIGNSGDWNDDGGFSFGPSVRGSGDAGAQERHVGPFHAVELAGSLDVEVHTGPGHHHKVEVTGDDNLLSYVDTYVDDGVLHVAWEDGVNVNPRRDMIVHVCAPHIDTVEVSGSGDIDVEGVHGDTFHASVLGSGDIVAAGACDRVVASVTGSGDIDLGGVVAKAAKASIEGSGDIFVFAEDSVMVEIEGSGDVVYRGDPGSVTSDIAGSGDVYRD